MTTYRINQIVEAKKLGKGYVTALNGWKEYVEILNKLEDSIEKELEYCFRSLLAKGKDFINKLNNEFIENIKMALEYKTNTLLSKKLLNRSLINLDEIALSSVSGDTNLLEDIDTIISDLKTNFNELYTNLQEESE
jgi:hypothetical protein